MPTSFIEWEDYFSARATRTGAAKPLHAEEYELCWICEVSEGLNMVRSMTEFSGGENVVVTHPLYSSSSYGWLHLREQGSRSGASRTEKAGLRRLA